MLLAIGLVLLAYAISRLTIVEPQKILLDFGLAAVSLSGILVSIFLGISSVSREIELKAIYTVLSKPISRSDYLLGKYLGCTVVILIVHLIMGVALGLLVAAMGTGLPNSFLSCNYLMLLESLLILAIALFSSIFSSTVLATSFTIGMFLIGRSAYILHTLAARNPDPASKWLLRSMHDILPNLDRFNIREVTAYSKHYPAEMLMQSSLYFLSYAGVFLLLSSRLFKRRDMP